MINKFDGWVNLFWIQFKQYFSNVTSWLTLFFVPIIFAFGLGAAIGVATGFIPALCMILIVLQANVFSNCYFSFKKSTLNSNLDLTSFNKVVEYTTTICLVFFTSLIGMFFAICVFAIDTQLLPQLGIDQFLPTAPAFVPNPVINAPQLVYMYFDGAPIEEIMEAKIRAPGIGDSFGKFTVVNAGYITSWLFFEWNVLFFFFFEVTISTVSISLLFTAIADEVKTYFLFMFGYLVTFMVFGGVMGPEYVYATADGSFTSFPSNGEPHGWMFYAERLNPLYYINQWAFTILATATVYEFDISYVDSNGETCIISLYQSMTPYLRMSYDSSLTPLIPDANSNTLVVNPWYCITMTSPRLQIENAIPETHRWVFSENSNLYNMLLYMPWVWSSFYIICTALIDYVRKIKR